MKKQNLKSAILFAVALLLIIGSIVPMMTERAMAGSLVSITFDANASDGHVTSATGPKVRTISTYDRQYQYSWSFPNAYRTGYTFGGWYDNASCTGTRVLPTNWKTSQTKLYAKWTPVTYTITFKPNGGTGGPTSQVKTHGKTLTITSSKPTKTGYDFVGWATSAGGSAQYYANGSYTKNEGATLYAVWKKKKFTITIYTSAGGPNGSAYTYTKEYGASFTIPSTSAPTGYYLAGYGIPTATTDVKYHVGDVYKEDKHLTLYPIFYKKTYPVTYYANGGSNPPANQIKTHGENLTLASGSPTRTGYTFQGWGTSANATTVAYSPKAVYTGNEELKLYAIWKINTYSVTYYANGGTGAPAGQIKTYNSNLSLSATKPTRTGYTFQGWGTSAGATTVAYNPSATYTGNAALNLYAIWKIDQYDVVFNANGGTGAPASVKKTYGQDLTLSGTIPTREGYDFKGWATSASGAVAYAANGTYKNNSAVTLYAVWEKKTYSITVLIGSGANGSSYTYTKEHGENFTIPSTSAPTGYYLAGYGIAGATTTVKYRVGDVYKDNAHLTLYTIFNKITYAVNYNANGGSNAPAAQTKTYGQDLTLSGTIPTREGYDFKGWATSATGAVAYAANGTYKDNSAVTLYAVWAKKTYTITIYSNPGGQNGSAYTMTKEHGVNVTIPSTSAPTGHHLAGYGVSGSITTVTYHAGDVYSENANLTLYPIFAADTYTIIYNANGGTDAPVAQTKTYGVDYRLSLTFPKRTGYTFKGWSDTASGSVKWAAGAMYTENKAITFYAVWEEITHTVRLCDNTGTGSNPGSVFSMTKRYGIALALAPCASREGYKFLGYAESQTAAVPDYRIGDVNNDLYTAEADVMLFAVWEISTYDVTYDLDGGTGAVSNLTRNHNIPITISSVIPEKEGYDFKGWEGNTADGGTKMYYGGTSFNENRDLYLTAVWEKKTFLVGYEPNGGTGCPGGQTKVYGEGLILSDVEPSRDGFVFIGWATYPQATVAKYQAGDVYTENANLMLYAVWGYNYINPENYVSSREGYFINKLYKQYLAAPGFLPLAQSGTLDSLGDSVKWTINKLPNGWYTISCGDKYLIDDGNRVSLARFGGDNSHIPLKAVWVVGSYSYHVGGYEETFQFVNYDTRRYLLQDTDNTISGVVSVGMADICDVTSNGSVANRASKWDFLETNEYSGDSNTNLHELTDYSYTLYNIVPNLTIDLFDNKTIQINRNGSIYGLTADDFDYEIIDGSSVALLGTKIEARKCGISMIRATHKLTGTSTVFSVTVPNTGIIVVPGMMGSQLKIDPFDSNQNGSGFEPKMSGYGTDDTYKELIQGLKAQFDGICDVRFCPYNWGKTNADSVAYLENMASEYDRVILICHSMGGLVATKYIANGIANESKIQKAFFIGTPFLGAPKNAYLMTGGNPAELADLGEKISILAQFAIEKGFTEEVALFDLACLYNEYIVESYGEDSEQYMMVPEDFDNSQLGEWIVGSAISATECLTMDSAYELLPCLSRDELLMCGLYDSQLGITCDEILTKIGNETFLKTVFGAQERLQHARSFRLGLWDPQKEHYTSHVDSYYIVGDGLMTINDMDGGGLHNGDGTVPIWSSTLNGKYQDKVMRYTGTNAGHTDLVKNSQVLSDIIYIIETTATENAIETEATENETNDSLSMPNAEYAVTPREKFVDYSLNPDNPHAGGKPEAYEKGLGYTRENADGLISQVHEYVTAGNKPYDIEQTEYGIKYRFRIPVTGPNGKTKNVIAVYQIDKGKSIPRMVTNYLEKKHND